MVVKASLFFFFIKRTCASKGWIGEKLYHRSSDMSSERTVHHFRAHGPPQQVLQMDIRAFIHTCTMWGHYLLKYSCTSHHWPFTHLWGAIILIQQWALLQTSIHGGRTPSACWVIVPGFTWYYFQIFFVVEKVISSCISGKKIRSTGGNVLKLPCCWARGISLSCRPLSLRKTRGSTRVDIKSPYKKNNNKVK